MKSSNNFNRKALNSVGIGAITLAIIAFPLNKKASAVMGVENFIPSGSLNTGFSGTTGSIFTLNSNAQVNSLGVYDVNEDGLLSSFDVNIWNSNTQALLGSVTVPGGADAPLVDGWRWADLASPVTLTAGQEYIIGTFYPNVSSEGFYFDEDLGVDWTSTLISSVDERLARGGSGTVFPSLTGNSNQAYLGPNFSTEAIESSSVPFDFSATPGLLAIGVFWSYKKMSNRYNAKSVNDSK